MPITQDEANRELGFQCANECTVVDSVRIAERWATYAQEALAEQRIEDAAACLAVLRKMLKG